MGRKRSTDFDRTVKRRIDVAKAFADEENPTRPAVSSHVPLDAVPVLAVPRKELPWEELGDLATQLLLRVDGETCTMGIATATATLGTPNDCARELARLAGQGLVRLVPAPGGADTAELALEIDLSAL